MMRDRKKHVAHIAFVVVVSVFGLVISTASLTNPAPLPAGSDGRRILVALAYDLVCIAGILAVLFPVACFRIRANKARVTPRGKKLLRNLLWVANGRDCFSRNYHRFRCYKLASLDW